MLQITVPGQEMWDENKEEFIYGKSCRLRLEHSLVSLSKWESKWQKSFLSRREKTNEETVDYVRCMTLTQNVPPEVYFCLTDENITEIESYIKAPMTAVKFFDSEEEGGSRETITAELIYYWMISLNIPFECQKWHLNRLLALIRVCQMKNSPPKRMGKNEILRRNTALNEARRKRLHSKG